MSLVPAKGEMNMEANIWKARRGKHVESKTKQTRGKQDEAKKTGRMQWLFMVHKQGFTSASLSVAFLATNTLNYYLAHAVPKTEMSIPLNREVQRNTSLM